MLTPKSPQKPVLGIPSLRTLQWILIAIIAARFLSLGLLPLLDKSEARYAYIGELMVLTGNWVTPMVDYGVPFWAKPVLSTWLTAITLLVFGLNVFAARLSSFLIFVALTWMVFTLGRRERNHGFALIAACIFGSMGLAFYLGGTVLTDPALLLGVTLTMTGYWLCVAEPSEHRRVWGYVFFVGVAIGLLAKGLIGAVIPGLSIVIWATHQRRWGDSWRRLPWIGGVLLTIVLVLPWYVDAEIHTPGFLRYFIIGEHFDRFLVSGWQGDHYGSSRPHPFGTIWLAGLACTMPWSVMLIGLLFRHKVRQELLRKAIFNDSWFSYLIYWTVAPLLFFTFTPNILLTYVATSLPAFALLAAHALWQRNRLQDRYTFVAACMIVPSLTLAATAFALAKPGSRELPTQAGIVATTKMLEGVGADNLVYIFNRPYSAEFYSRGAAMLATSNEEAEQAYDNGAKYFAVAKGSYDRLSEGLRQRLEVIAEKNNTLLLRRR